MLFIMLFKTIVTFWSVDEIHFPVVLPVIMGYKVILPFESVNEILKCDHSNETTE